MLTMITTVKGIMMEKILQNFKEPLYNLYIWHVNFIFVLNFTLKPLMKWKSINFLWKFNIIFQRNFGDDCVFVESLQIVHKEKKAQFLK